MALLEVSIVPIGTGTSSVSKYVAGALKVAGAAKGVAYQLTPMGTILEGDLDTAMRLVRQMHDSAFDDEVQRVLTTVVIDDRRDKQATMESKTRSVQQKLGT